MKKVLIVLLSAVTIFAPMQVAKATDERVVAIIDTAIDSSKFPSIIYEVCFTQNKSCLNKTNFMEGKGSANSLIWPASMLNSVYHGHSMVAASVNTNPNIKIVFVRIADITAQGNSGNQPQSLSLAIDWVSKNAAKFSIDAVSISQSGTSSNNLLSCSRDTVVINAVASLNAQNVPTFAATGNDRLTDKVGFPACVNGAIGVGAVDANGTTFHAVTNRGPGLDIVANGSMDVVRYNGTVVTATGTSVANVVAATKYVSQTNMFSQFIAGLTKFLTYPFIK